MRLELEPCWLFNRDFEMDTQSNSEKVHLLLSDLCTQLGFSRAMQEPQKFERLVSAGVDPFTDAVLKTEGSAPGRQKQLRRDVRAFVADRFERWGGA